MKKCIYWTKDLEEICKLVRVLYEDMHESAGGLLHIALDDGNLDDDNIQWCIEYCNSQEYADRHDKYICLEIAHRMLNLNYIERMLVYYQWDVKFCCGNCDECVITSEEDEW